MSRPCPPLVFRCDASLVLGVGHVMRCLALAQGWQDAGGEAIFVTRALPAALQKRLQAERIRIVELAAESEADDAKETASAAREHGAGWVVADGYHFPHHWQRVVRDAGLRVLAFDDYGQIGRHCADIVVDQNVGTRAELYADCAPEGRLLLGPRYVLLRREFRRWQEWRREATAVARRILVTLGGADPQNATLKIVRALDRIGQADLEAVVLVGPANPHRAELETWARQTAVSIVVSPPIEDVSELMAWGDIGVAAGGTTCWELAFVGLPSLLFVLAANQARAAHAADAVGVARNLGRPDDVSDSEVSESIAELLADAPLRSRMTARGRECVDGDGVERSVMHLRGEPLRLRAVRAHDAELLWQWANDLSVRRASLSRGPITWEEHLRWFARKKRGPGCVMFLGLDEADEPVGHVRIDGGSEADPEIHVVVAADRRGQGWGTRLIRAAIERAGPRRVHAVIKEDNPSSLRAFEKAGFGRVASDTRHGVRVVHAVYPRGETTR